jgi:transmembrane sensor
MSKESESMEMQGQAEHWFVQLLDPNVSEADRAAAEQWRAQSPSHELAWQQVQKIWSATELLAADDAVAQALRRAERNVDRPESFWRGWFSLKGLGAVALVVLAISATGRWLDQDLPPGTSYATAVGEQKTIVLEDGSTVVLDTATAITARFLKNERRIDLEQGQADFQVKSDKQKPFVVYAEGGFVTAVGTRFQVRAKGTGVSVVLLEGVVKVDSPKSENGTRVTAMLEPGQRLQFDRADNRWNKETVDLEASLGWAEGNLFARNWRLGDLLNEMNRYSSTQLRLSDPNLADLPISGTFKVGDHASLVLALEHGWALHAENGKADEIVLRK